MGPEREQLGLEAVSVAALYDQEMAAQKSLSSWRRSTVMVPLRPPVTCSPSWVMNAERLCPSSSTGDFVRAASVVTQESRRRG